MYTSFEELKKDCLKCNKCPLAATRTNVVFGVGPEDAEVLFIGEGPGENEDLTGQPFVGRGGKLLDQYLYDVDLDRNKKYLHSKYRKMPSAEKPRSAAAGAGIVRDVAEGAG